MMELLPLGVSLHKEIKKACLNQRQDAAALTQTAEALVILTTCLFSFVVGEHEIPGMKCDHHVPATLIATLDGKYC